MQFSPASYLFIHLRSKYSPQHPVVGHKLKKVKTARNRRCEVWPKQCRKCMQSITILEPRYLESQKSYERMCRAENLCFIY
jgi:hypothetical protein